MPNIVYADGFNPSVGDVVKIEKSDSAECVGMVVVAEKEQFGFTPFNFIEGARAGDKVLFLKEGLNFLKGRNL